MAKIEMSPLQLARFYRALSPEERLEYNKQLDDDTLMKLSDIDNSLYQYEGYIQSGYSPQDAYNAVKDTALSQGSFWDDNLINLGTYSSSKQVSNNVPNYDNKNTIVDYTSYDSPTQYTPGIQISTNGKIAIPPQMIMPVELDPLGLQTKGYAMPDYSDRYARRMMRYNERQDRKIGRKATREIERNMNEAIDNSGILDRYGDDWELDTTGLDMNPLNQPYLLTPKEYIERERTPKEVATKKPSTVKSSTRKSSTKKVTTKEVKGTPPPSYLSDYNRTNSWYSGNTYNPAFEKAASDFMYRERGREVASKRQAKEDNSFRNSIIRAAQNTK